MNPPYAGDVAKPWTIIASGTGEVMTGDSHIRNLREAGPDEDPSAITGTWVSPWLCDTHTHGRDGYAVSADPQEMNALVQSYAADGVGSVQLSTVTMDSESIHGILEAGRQVKASLASLVGIHLEGPFLSPHKRGAHSKEDLEFGDLERVKRLLGDYLDIVTAITLDPLSVETGVISWLVEQGVTVAIGHTEADYEQTVEAFSDGASVLTHAFNAMPAITAREPGPVLAAINHSAWIELIADGHHVHPDLVSLVFDLAPDRVVLVTDSIPATGLPDGEYSLGRVRTEVVNGVARTPEGALAGSTLRLDEAVRNVVSWGVSPELALASATTNPRQAYGLQVPSITVGEPADILVWNEEMVCVLSMRDGSPPTRQS